jgi:aspartate oxidase
LEALAFAEFCFRDIEKIIHDISININTIEMDYSFQVGCHANDTIHVLRKRVQNVMSKYVGVNRTTKGLRYALGYLQLAEKRLEDFYPRWISAELLELRNILIAAKLIVVQSLNRKVNKGAFYNVDLDPAFVSTSNKLDVSHG